MFKFAQLVAVAAAATSTTSAAEATAKADEAKAKHSLAAAQAKLSASIKIGTSKVDKLFTMPGAALPVPPTLNSLSAAYDNNDAHFAHRCIQCSFAGGDWSPVITTPAVAAHGTHPVVKEIPAVLSTTQHYCHFTGALETSAKLTGIHAVPAVVDGDLEYEHMFDEFTTCHGKAAVTEAHQVDLYSAANKAHLASDAQFQTNSALHIHFDAATFASNAASTWSVGWATTASGKAPFVGGAVVLPHGFAGGLFFEVANTDHTHFAMRVVAGTDRYFDAASAKAESIGTTNKNSLLYANAVEFLVQGTSTWTPAANKLKPFSIKFQRASYEEIAKFTAVNGGTTMWIIIGVVVVVLCCVTGCIYHYCKNKDQDDEDKNFYQVEDCYARI